MTDLVSEDQILEDRVRYNQLAQSLGLVGKTGITEDFLKSNRVKRLAEVLER